MAELLLDRIRAELRDRLRASADAVHEYERLEAALAALGASKSTGGERSAPRSSSRRGSTSSSRAAGRARVGAARPRAPRGANRAAVLKVVAERPGVSVSELSSASGIAKPVLYNLLKTL